MRTSYHKIAQTVAFSQAAAATHDVFTPDADKKFVVTKWYLMPAGAVTVQFISSGTPTNLSGAMPFQANIAYSDGSGDEAVLIGDANGAKLQIALGGAVQVSGYVVVGQLQE